MLALAELITQKRVPGRAVMEAQALYEQCISTQHTRIKALYALANLLATHTEELDALHLGLSSAHNCKDEIVTKPEYQGLLLGCERIIVTISKKLNDAMARTYPQLAFRVPVPPTIPDRPTYTGPSVGRNEPCPCGSQKKYKHCCL